MSAIPPAEALSDDPARRRSQRLRGFLILGVVILVAGGGWFIWHAMSGAETVKTENAYVGASIAQITPQVGGALATVPIHESQVVQAGDVLATIDPADARIALARAQAQYGQAVSRVRGYLAADVAAAAQNEAQRAVIARAQADLERAQSDRDRARGDLARRQSLAGSGAVSGEEITTAQAMVRTTEAAVAQSQAAITQAQAAQRAAAANVEQQRAISGGGAIAANPEVAAARAAVEAAQLDLERTTIRAPIGGVIVDNKAQIGQRVQAGAVLMRIAPIQDAFVDANFKEAQLRGVRVGQPVELIADLYGKKVVFHGRVIGIGGGTGAAFSAIPAQNATGNWIKVVQRVPVRITLDPKELADHPLRVGLSMSAKIDVSGAR